ncbi:unnamed protein product [Somion occarium]|uniref:Uncharacterized protein n=1 Tax=Somion occarium TaxID=3059160 RepID=A0ABP1DU29_9APHY
MSMATVSRSGPQPDTAELRELLGTMKTTLGTLGHTFKTLNEQSDKISTLGPTMQHASVQIHGLRQQIQKQDRKQEVRVNEIKSMIQNEMKDKFALDLQSFINDQIRKETALQVKEQVSLQMKDHVPLSLEEQVEGSRKQLIEVRHALQNSESRRANSTLETDNLNDTLQVVLKPDGTKSALYPANLNSLFAYSPKMLKELLKDHGLLEHGSKEKNLNRFMSHIGIRFQLVPLPEGETN